MLEIFNTFSVGHCRQIIIMNWIGSFWNSKTPKLLKCCKVSENIQSHLIGTSSTFIKSDSFSELTVLKFLNCLKISTFFHMDKVGTSSAWLNAVLLRLKDIISPKKFKIVNYFSIGHSRYIINMKENGSFWELKTPNILKRWKVWTVFQSHIVETSSSWSTLVHFEIQRPQNSWKMENIRSFFNLTKQAHQQQECERFILRVEDTNFPTCWKFWVIYQSDIVVQHQVDLYWYILKVKDPKVPKMLQNIRKISIRHCRYFINVFQKWFIFAVKRIKNP